MAQIPIYIVDAFTNEPFTGNPAAVCLLQEDLSSDTCQKIALEMNLSETAFVRLLDKGDTFDKSNKFGLRWFTPTNEVPLCGHATLSSVELVSLNSENFEGNFNEKVHFETMRGQLICRRSNDTMVTMDFPQWQVAKAENEPIFCAVVSETVKKLPVHDVWYSHDSRKLLIILEDTVQRSALEELQVNWRKLLDLHPKGEKITGVSITMKGTLSNGCVNKNGKVYDFVSRYFSPWNGIPEDPVTGSIHCSLGPYWAKVLGKTELYARQCSARGGELNLNVRSDGRINISGASIIILNGWFKL